MERIRLIRRIQYGKIIAELVLEGFGVYLLVSLKRERGPQNGV